MDALWGAESAPLRKTERFKKFVRDSSLYDYWREHGWPDLCRPVPRQGAGVPPSATGPRYDPQTEDLFGFGGLQRVEAVHILNQYATDVIWAGIVARDGGRVIWSFELADEVVKPMVLRPVRAKKSTAGLASPLSRKQEDAPFGAMFSAVTAAALVFEKPFPSHIDNPRVADLLRWRSFAGDSLPSDAPASLGNIWFVGLGSVGSAVVYFLTLAGLKFESTLIDKDIVKIHNLDRSPIFQLAHVDHPKVEAVAEFLRSAGMVAGRDAVSLRDSMSWGNRQQGVPDLLISAANEEDVRYEIESLYPPIQIFGTTGQNWQSTLLTHIPPHSPCTCCIFPPGVPQSTDCAIDGGSRDKNETERVDAALPFLSFAAGLMTAIEVSKLSLPGYPFSENRVFFQPCSDEFIVTRATQRRQGCAYLQRHEKVHRAMISGTRYAQLCDFD